jgi:hypothetical protein
LSGGGGGGEGSVVADSDGVEVVGSELSIAVELVVAIVVDATVVVDSEPAPPESFPKKTI